MTPSGPIVSSFPNVLLLENFAPQVLKGRISQSQPLNRAQRSNEAVVENTQNKHSYMYMCTLLAALSFLLLKAGYLSVSASYLQQAERR